MHVAYTIFKITTISYYNILSRSLALLMYMHQCESLFSCTTSLVLQVNEIVLYHLNEVNVSSGILQVWIDIISLFITQHGTQEENNE